MGEMFPSRYRTLLGPMSSSFNLLCTFTVVRSFPEMQATLGKYGAFWFFMCCTLLSIVFIFFLLPETKGKTLEEIEKFFTRKTEAQQQHCDGGCNMDQGVMAKNVKDSVCINLNPVLCQQKSLNVYEPTYFAPSVDPAIIKELGNDEVDLSMSS